MWCPPALQAGSGGVTAMMSSIRSELLTVDVALSPYTSLDPVEGFRAAVGGRGLLLLGCLQLFEDYRTCGACLWWLTEEHGMRYGPPCSVHMRSEADQVVILCCSSTTAGNSAQRGARVHQSSLCTSPAGAPLRAGTPREPGGHMHGVWHVGVWCASVLSC